MASVVRAAFLQGYETFAQSFQFDTEQALQRVGLSKRMLEDLDAFISSFSVINLLEQTAAELACPSFGLQLVLQRDLSNLGAMALLIKHCETLRDALDYASRYVYIYSPTARLSFEPVNDDSSLVDYVFDLNIPHMPACPQSYDMGLGMIVRGLQQVSQGNIKPVLVQFPYPSNGLIREYETLLGCPCKFYATKAAIRFRETDLRIVLVEQNNMLMNLAEQFLNQNFGGPDQLFLDLVRRTIRQLLGMKPISQEMVANALSMHPRTLQRRLQAEGHQFKTVHDSVLREQLFELLSTKTPMTMMQVATALGYSDQATLTRSCQRWFKCTPTKLRQMLHGEENA